MRILFLHQNCPAQFGPLISRLKTNKDYEITFCCKSGEQIPDIETVVYNPQGGATRQTHFYTRSMENIAHHSQAAFSAIAQKKDCRPDLIVAHSGFVSAVPLQEKYRCPVISYLEYFYHTRGADMDFRPDHVPNPEENVRAIFRNAPLLMDLEYSAAGLSPTKWQRDRFPEKYRSKIDVVFDGVDQQIWHKKPKQEKRKVGRIIVPDDIELVTYAARGLESMRGFDIFMKFAKQLYLKRPNVRFLVAGSDRVVYGADEKKTAGKTYKQWIWEQDDYDKSKFVFLKPMPADQLAELFSISDLHVYLTVPFVLSWSLLNAMACGVTILASKTAPVEEVLTHGRTGLLCDFFDTDEMVKQANKVLDDPLLFKSLGESCIKKITKEYSLDVTYPQHLKLFEKVVKNFRK